MWECIVEGVDVNVNLELSENTHNIKLTDNYRPGILSTVYTSNKRSFVEL